MFLNQLSELEKETFLSLAVRAAESNGDFNEDEYGMIEEYCKEMGISFFDVRHTKTVDEIIDIFKTAEESHKKIVLLESIGLMYADGTFDDEEKRFIVEYAKKMDLTEVDVERMIDLFNRYIDISKEIMSEIG